MRRLLASSVLVACSLSRPASKEQLGKRVFEDPALSNPAGQACADCHAAKFAFRDPESDRATSMGVISGRFGARNTPTVLYAAYIPPLHFDPAGERWIGGLFWDGRAQTLEDQAAGPLLNPLEMNNPDKATVVAHVRAASYAAQFRDLFGAYALDDIDTAFAHVTEVLAAYERTPELSPFASKYDRYLAGTAVLSPAEQRGLALFEDPLRGNCASCHPSRPSSDGTPPLFTDFSYANIGIPRYENSRSVGVDHGLANTVGDPAQDGKFRVPTLRDISRTAPYSHSGYFENVPYMIEFFATRDEGSRSVETCSRAAGIAVRCAWPLPEVPANVEPRVGHLPLGERDISDLAAFLETLTDEVP